MPQFMITYFGGDKPSTQEEGKAHFAKYQEWLGSLGDAAIKPMNPLKGTHTITPNGESSEGSATDMSGFTIVEADSMEAALEMAKKCPFLEVNGTLEVAEMIQM